MRILIGNVLNPSSREVPQGMTVRQAVQQFGHELNGGQGVRFNGTDLASVNQDQVLRENDSLVWAKQTKGNVRILVGNVLNPASRELADGTTVRQAVSQLSGELNGGQGVRFNGTDLASVNQDQVLRENDSLVWAKQTKGNLFVRILRCLFAR